MTKKKVLGICGSTRANSTNENILKGIASLHDAEFDLQIYNSISELPHFNPDLEDSGLPASVTKFRNAIENADGVIICTPEYVFSLPGVLKNALEWTIATTIFLNKPTASIVASGMGEKAFESLSIILNTVGAKMTEHSAILLSGARTKFNQQGLPVDELTEQKLNKCIKAFKDTLVGNT